MNIMTEATISTRMRQNDFYTEQPLSSHPLFPSQVTFTCDEASQPLSGPDQIICLPTGDDDYHPSSLGMMMIVNPICNDDYPLHREMERPHTSLQTSAMPSDH